MVQKLYLLVVGLLMFSISIAADRDDHAYRESSLIFDGRYNHNHYYPPTGYVSHDLPYTAVEVNHLGATYYFHEGSWYRPRGRAEFYVVAPPIGLFVPILPPAYTTIWSAGSPYYYANEVYYIHAPDRDGYIVTAAPQNVTTPNKTDDSLFSYPKNGQSEDQQARDRYECYRWAADETGFDITKPLGGVAASEVESKRSAYHRAETACLEARGYSVR